MQMGTWRSEWRQTDMLKFVMKAVLGSSTSKKISWEVFALFRALEVMTVWAKRDVTVQSTITLYTSTIWEDDMGREIGAATLINHEFQNVSNVSYYIRQAWPVAERTGSLFLSLLNSGSDVVRNVPKRFVSQHTERSLFCKHIVRQNF